MKPSDPTEICGASFTVVLSDADPLVPLSSWTTTVSRLHPANHRPVPAYVLGGGLVASAPRKNPLPGRGKVGLTTWMVVLHAATPGEDPDRQSFQLAVRAATAPAALVEGLDRWRDASNLSLLQLYRQVSSIRVRWRGGFRPLEIMRPSAR